MVVLDSATTRNLQVVVLDSATTRSLHVVILNSAATRNRQVVVLDSATTRSLILAPEEERKELLLLVSIRGRRLARHSRGSGYTLAELAPPLLGLIS